MTEQLNIILNGKIVKGNPGETVLELAQRQKIEIPTLCHDPRLEPYLSCSKMKPVLKDISFLQTYFPGVNAGKKSYFSKVVKN